MANQIDIEVLRIEAWDGVVHAEGTRAIFRRRYDRLKRWTRIRDALALIIPLVAAFIYSTDWVQKFSTYKQIALAVLTLLALAQGIIVIVALISSWDEEFAYSTRAQRDSADLRDSWRIAAKSATDNLYAQISQLHERRKLLDSHDEEKGLSDWERQFGMRAGLIFCQRKCVCENLPSSRKPPSKPITPCVVCGGN